MRSAILSKSHLLPVSKVHIKRLCSSIPTPSSLVPELKRHPFKEVTESDVSAFERILGKNSVLTETNDVEPYNIDWLRTLKGSSKVVLKPHSTAEVSSILKYCHEKNLAVVPQGGNTGLVGGSIPIFDEVIVSTQAMNKIEYLNDIEGIAVCQSGVILETLENQLNPLGLTVPLDLGAKGSCHIGGNVSTNAGGLRLLRYGSLHGSVLGLEAVLSDGTILDCLSTLRKDNTGYDLKQLFIGSEGTLGMVTKVSILCPPKPTSVNVAFLGCRDYSRVLNVFTAARRNLLEILSAFEMMDSASMDVVTTNLNLRNPFATNYPFYVLIETSGSNGQHDQEKLSQFLDIAMSDELIEDGVLAQDMEQMKNLFEIRERMADALMLYPTRCMLDMSLPLSLFWQIVLDVKKQFETSYSSLLITAFGHMGDGNLHLNFVSSKYEPEILQSIEPFVFEWIAKHRGSVSAEHGLGFRKAKYIGYSKSPAAVEYMRQIKRSFDPKGLLNPYKVLPPV